MVVRVRALPVWAQLVCPAALCVPYLLVAYGSGVFRWGWLAVYAALPVAITILLWRAGCADAAQSPQRPGPVAGGPDHQRGNWRDFLVLALLGLAVDLRWFEGAWPPHLAIFSKILLLDAGIYGFLLIRQLEGAGFDLRLRLKDAFIGLREVAFQGKRKSNAKAGAEKDQGTDEIRFDEDAADADKRREEMATPLTPLRAVRLRKPKKSSHVSFAQAA